MISEIRSVKMAFYNNTYPLPNWLLCIDEVSNGHFKVSLTDQHKRRVELSCPDGELSANVQECIDWAKNIEASSFRKTGDRIHE